MLGWRRTPTAPRILLFLSAGQVGTSKTFAGLACPGNGLTDRPHTL